MGKVCVVHVLSTWGSGNHLVLGQLEVVEKNNEITAIPQLLDLLVIKGCLVAIDAMGLSERHRIRNSREKTDYLIAVRGNQGKSSETDTGQLPFSAHRFHF